MKKINPLSLALKLGLLFILAYITQSSPNFYKNRKSEIHHKKTTQQAFYEKFKKSSNQASMY